MRNHVDYEMKISRRQTWIAALIGIAASLVVGTYASAAPKAFFANEVLKADDLNANFNDIETRLGSVQGKETTVTAWTNYDAEMTADTTPVTTTLDVNGATAKGAWRRVGDSIDVRISMQVPTCSTPGKLYWTLPNGVQPDLAKSAGTYLPIGHAFLARPSSTSTSALVVGPQPSGPNGNQVELTTDGALGAVRCSDFVPNEVVRMSFSLPVAGWEVGN